jgi:periplasmic protein TonB
MIPFDELKSPAVALAWHEVAALVLDAATALDEQPDGNLADLAAIQLTGEGYVVLPHGGGEGSPTLRLARLLDDLLQDLPAPDALGELATRPRANLSDEADVEAFVAELSRFERPDRTAILSQLAARAASVDRHVEGPTALAQLASRVRAQERAAPDTPAGVTAGRRRRWSAPAVAAVAVAAAAAALLASAYYVAPPRLPGAAPQPVVERVRAGAAVLADAAKQVLRPTPPPEPASAPSAPPTAPTQARSARPRRASEPTPAPDHVVSLRSLEGQTPPPEADAEVPVPTAAVPTVYTSADADVTPAALLRPHLPSAPPASLPPDEVGILELTVTETGQVAHVKLLSTSNRYQERMLVAAAKTWRFQPATKDGRPVRFRARVRITL